MKEVHIVIKLTKDEPPKILEVFKRLKDAEALAYGTPWKDGEWVNIITKEVK